MAERKQSVLMVREGEEVTIKFENAAWLPSELVVTNEGGIVNVAGKQDGLTVQAQFLNLRRR